MNEMDKAPQELKDEFERYMIGMEFTLERLMTKAINAGFELDYSIESAGLVERLIDKLWTDDEVSNKNLRTQAGTYLGEVFRRNIGGRWELSWDDNNSLYRGMPVLLGYSSHNLVCSPISTLIQYIGRRKEGLLERAIRAHIPHADLVEK